MSYLLAVAVGPVQEFIAAARRTRDLWFGSYLLSEISREVAKSIESSGGTLIFPASLDVESVANIILAELSAGVPSDLVVKAKREAQQRWLKFAGEVQLEISGMIRQEIWEDQVEDVIEFYSAWVERSADHAKDRGNVMRLLAGRKNCRDFLPAKGRVGVPKSSLDGQRESVLKASGQVHDSERIHSKLRLREGEQLDVVGVVKRISGGKKSYPSVARIAADPWVRGCKIQGEKKFQAVLDECEHLGANKVHRLSSEQFPQFQGFPYEGTAVFLDRHHEWREELGVSNEQLNALRVALSKLPEPLPYLAVLVADGDRIGAAIGELESPEDNRRFSEDLAGFSAKAKDIVIDNRGVLVYAGGDDVLAFLPVDQCLSCARQLHEDFGVRLKNYHGSPTLSVGIAIGHFMENLEDLLEYGRAAEKSAKKPDRNGLAVHLHKRGGVPVQIRGQWSDDPDQRIVDYAALIRRDAIPGKLSYDLQTLADVYDKWAPETLAKALQADVLRVIRDKQPKAGRAYMTNVKEIVQDRLTDSASLRQFSKELLVARQIALAMNQVTPSGQVEEVTV